MLRFIEDHGIHHLFLGLLHRLLVSLSPAQIVLLELGKILPGKLLFILLIPGKEIFSCICPKSSQMTPL